MRFLLLILFVVMFLGDALGVNISLAPGLSTKNLLLYILFTWIAIEGSVTGNRRLQCMIVFVPFLLLVLYAVFSWLVVVLIVDYQNYSVLSSAIGLKSELADALLMLLVFFYGVTNTKDCIWLLRAIVWVFMLANFVTLADTFRLIDILVLDENYEGRLQGFPGQPNKYGALLSFFFPATIALVLIETGLRRWVAVLGSIATLLCLVLTFSRGSYVGVIFGAVVGAFFLRKYVPLSLVGKTLTVVVLALVISGPVLFLSGYDEIFRDRFAMLGGSAHSVTTGRSTLWLRALLVMAREPMTFLIGYGWQAYDSFSEFRLSVHSVYLNYFFNLGIIGLTLFLTILAATCTNLRRGIASAEGAAKALIVGTTFALISVCGTTIFSEFYGAELLIWSFVGLALRVCVNSTQRDHAANLPTLSASARPSMS